MHMLFAAICFFASTCSVFQALVLTSDSVPGFIQASRVEPVADGDFAVCMLWFVASYTRIVPNLLLSGLTLVIALAIVAALTQPQGLPVRFDHRPQQGDAAVGRGLHPCRGADQLGFQARPAGAGCHVHLHDLRHGQRGAPQPSRNNIGMLLAVVFYVMCYTEAPWSGRMSSISCRWGPMASWGSFSS
jgi:hypothetical protein